ncbi:hypothetical protein KXD96_15535 [Mycobacterium sp. SMC-2]|uniref:hypothetical protein n=1 Tax=Mycobacterium sp. SMC-2 TaxID=2857058 RepID=UPI0021B2AECF|nr:hypothetical protein [Mycobacterium sp. SMC-2]UXA04437.1 hypothetical protein KXD96_15535 [Mycobacterium sp. SMC-2]
MAVTLSEIRAWSTEPLVNAATYWSKTADQWEDVFLTMRSQSQSITWQGAGGDALRQRTSADLSTVSGKADQLRQAAGIARNGASDISAAQHRALYAVEDAQNAGFDVGEDLSVSYTERGGTPAEQAARQAQAEQLASEIWSRAAALEGADAKVAGQLTATAGDVGNVSFANPRGGQNSATKGGSQNGQGSPNGGRNGHVTPAVADGQHGGVQLVDFTQDNATNPPPFAPWDTPDGTPPPPSQPGGFLPQYQQSIAAPPAPKPGPPASPLPSPSTTPLPNPTVVGPAAAAPAKPPCSPYDATKAILEPPVGMVGILTAVPESLTLAGIPVALGQIAAGTVAVADGLDAADKCLP